MTVFRGTRESPEDSHINVPPLYGDALGGPAEGTQEGHDEVSNQFVLTWSLAEGLAVPKERHEIKPKFKLRHYPFGTEWPQNKPERKLSNLTDRDCQTR